MALPNHIFAGRCSRFKRRCAALPSAPYDGHTLATIIPDLEKQIGVALDRIIADAGYRGHNAPPTHALRDTAWIAIISPDAFRNIVEERPSTIPLLPVG